MRSSTPGRPVVVVHGLWMPGPETILLRRRVARAGFAPRVFRYPSVRAPLADNAAGLAEMIEALGAPAVDLIGYSLGGLVALTMLERYRPAHEGRVVCLGSPFKGSMSAERLARVPGGGRLLGASLRELVERGGFTAWRGPQPLGVIAGSLNVSFARLLGRLPGVNDGTVTVEETRLAGAADHIVLPASHTTLMFSRAVADETIHFLCHGVFSRDARRDV